MKNTIKLFSVLIMALGMSLSAAAQIEVTPVVPSQDETVKAQCISAQDMTEIAKSFKQYQNLSGKEYCFDGSQLSYLLAGLNYIRKLEFVEPQVKSQDELFSGKFAQNWFGYFTTRIKTIAIEQNCPQGAIAYVMGFFHNNTMHVCPIGLTDSFTPMDLASVFMHEARHIDGFPHVMCSEGPRAGLSGACDKRISDGGSYAVTVETYSQLGQYGKNINPAYRAIAQASALIYGAESFQQPVKINTEEAFLALTEDKKIFKIEPSLDKEAVQVGETAALGHIIKNKPGLLILPQDKNQKITRIYPTGETQAISVEYNDDTVANRSNVVDYYFAWTWNARIEKNKVTFFCDKRERPTLKSDVALNGEALSIVYPEGYSPANNFAYLMTTQGVVKIGCTGSKGEVSAANVTIDSDIKRIHKAQGTTLALTQTGELLNMNNRSERINLGIGNIVDITSYTRATFFDKK